MLDIEHLLQADNLGLRCRPVPFSVPLVVSECGIRAFSEPPPFISRAFRDGCAVSNLCPFQGMTSQLSCPLTVKMRVGWDEKKPNADSVSIIGMYWVRG